MGEFIPKWQKELDIFDRIKPIVILEGNVLDKYQYPGDEAMQQGSIDKALCKINDIDKNGDIFRYPTSYSLEYKFDNVKIDISNIYKYSKSLINFLDGCDSMLDEIAEYESDMKAEYAAEMSAYIDW